MLYIHLFPQVRSGARVSQDLANYWDRVWTNTMNIEVRNVNYSDQGYYTLKDRSSRIVSVTRMDLTGWSQIQIYGILYCTLRCC